MEFLNELHKNKRIKIRLCIAIFLAFIDRVALAYLAYVIITEILRFMSRRNMPFLNSIYVKIFLIIFLSGIVDFFAKSADNEGWAMIVAYMLIAFLLEQPFKLFVKRESDKRTKRKYGLDYDFIEEEKELGFKTNKSRQSQESESFHVSFTLKNNKKRKRGSATDFEFEEGLNTHQSTTDQEEPQRVQYKVSVCPSCGFRNKIVLGNVESCEYCGSPID